MNLDAGESLAGVELPPRENHNPTVQLSDGQWVRRCEKSTVTVIMGLTINAPVTKLYRLGKAR